MGETEETENDHVQEVMAQRSRKKDFSGCCGGWYGSKVWHSTDQYRRVIWQCNGKYKGKTRPCKTPHLTEDEIKAAFIRMVNKLAAERGSLIADLREIQKTYSVTAELERTLRELDERMNTEADAVQDLIATNARVAQHKLQMLHKCAKVTLISTEKQAEMLQSSDISKIFCEMAKKAGQHPPPRRSHTVIPLPAFVQSGIVFSVCGLSIQTRSVPFQITPE